ncbi:MAG: tyrosine-type recombinase/integrase, partial [Pseudomonadota bacterium]
LDRIRRNLGKHPLDSLKVHHIEKVMDKMDGPNAANRLKKDLAQLYKHAARFHGFAGPTPAAHAQARKVRKGGFHTWTMGEVNKFRETFPTGSKARLAMELLLNSGAARVDLVRLGQRDVKDGALSYRRQKTEAQGEEVIDVTIPITHHLRAELDANPSRALTFLAHGKTGACYTPGSFGNAFRDWCIEAGVPGRAHGLRKAGATSLAEAGATEWEISSYLGHASTKEAKTYVAAANRALLAASGMEKRAKREQVLSNLAERLDKID